MMLISTVSSYLSSSKLHSVHPSSLSAWARLSLLLNFQKGEASVERLVWHVLLGFPVNIYLFKVKNENTRKGCEISSKVTIVNLVGKRISQRC